MDPGSWSLAAEHAEDVAKAVAAGRLSPEARGWRATLADGRAVELSRLYAGDEFCQHLIPSRAELAAFGELADERRVPLTLCTPPVTDDGLERIRPLLHEIAGRAGAEVVANDWGTLRAAARYVPGLRRLLGRALCRQLKDPRAATREATAAASDAYLGLLRRLGVSMVSMDRLPDGDPPLPLAVHVPFEFVTTGRVCSVSGVAFAEPERKFLCDFACPRPCRTFQLQLRDPGCRDPMRQKGNTLFVPNGGASLVAKAAGRVGRWVYDLSVDVTYSLLAAPAEEARP